MGTTLDRLRAMAGKQPPLETARTAPAVAGHARVAPGMLIGRYVVIERVGAGGMGVVYSAFDPELERKLALKFLNENDAEASTRARFQREAQALAQLVHPNVVGVHDIGVWESQVFIAMDFV